MELIDDGEMVQQSVANWTRIQAKMLDQYSMSGSWHSKGADCDHFCGCADCDFECRCNHEGNWHNSFSIALVKL